ncbi:RagB/SusD family nutrient uptake outer membrane protein [Candidatus Sulfidibacterium hydrothermale]|uniref:RagB/SusD family nutrient uptake outer membrane protein n=1 Tax=Candidatus Sulfidibacterium hydrothermale TaxID=2875962 RepID=UPI001F0B2EA9|nr:RagB/SusD family nutrient uptake outer membrane protein [Candidatus Sulfidibacterium hydrothermale]UBM63391.1 RagB/SusD family nutrient uptake outer membrane protein [Candidatus Sulfidibacterium hydrothermale]
MKIYKYIISITMAFLVASCSLTETPPFMSNDSAYATLDNARSSLDGVYNAMVNYGDYSHQFLYLTYGNSGFFVSGKGNRNTQSDNVHLCSLQPLNSTPHLERVWKQSYQAIGRANDIIASMKPIDNPANSDQEGMNDVLGQAYFLRAFNYFNLVRLWGDVPLRLAPTLPSTINMPKSPSKDIYAQIIKDADIAKTLMYPKGKERKGYPAAEAASMLKAKVYMTLATADQSIQPDPNANYWQLAYNEAKEVYGKYQLVSDYATLWDENTDNTVESIFELQFNEIQASNYPRLFTAYGATEGKTWGRLKINPEVYDLQASVYPNDPRIAQTFISEYFNVKRNKLVKVYPSTNRTYFGNGFPYLYKYWEKNPKNTSNVNNKNFIVYRYADLLLMLAEISNELQNGEQMGYVTQVLDRVGLKPQAEYYNGQEGFRKAIMEEYRFELLGEGHDWFNNRRRGYQFFRENVIVPHNTAPTFNPKIDVTLLDNDESVMHLPIPASEINTNEDIKN